MVQRKPSPAHPINLHDGRQSRRHSLNMQTLIRNSCKLGTEVGTGVAGVGADDGTGLNVVLCNFPSSPLIMRDNGHVNMLSQGLENAHWVSTCNGPQV